MSIKSGIKLVSSLFFVAIVCAGLLIYVNANMATVESRSASLEFSSYAVGSEYDGIISRQYVVSGDKVTAGQSLFEISSDVLKQRLASGTTKPSDLNYKLTSDKDLIISAQNNGVIGKVNFVQRSFVTSGQVLATINDTSQAKVKAEFNLSGPQYSKLNPSTPLTVTLAGGKKVASTIKGISQKSKDGKTITTVTAAATNLDSNQVVYDNETPITMKLTLNTDIYYDRLVRLASANGIK